MSTCHSNVNVGLSSHICHTMDESKVYPERTPLYNPGQCSHLLPIAEISMWDMYSYIHGENASSRVDCLFIVFSKTYSLTYTTNIMGNNFQVNNL